MEVAFYTARPGGIFESSPATAGPWSPTLQHGGPPSALLARAIEAEPAPVPQRLARLTVEILRPVPVAPLTIRAEITRPGRKVSLVEAVGLAEGVECLRARGWRIEVPERPGPSLEGPAEIPSRPTVGELYAWPGAYLDGYMSAIDWRPTAGALNQLGPADVWARSRVELVEGETTSPFCRAAIVADSGSGIALSFDLQSIHAINVDLTLTMWRDIIGEWVFMSARTVSGSVGAGIAETRLGDAEGMAGLATQTMLVAHR